MSTIYVASCRTLLLAVFWLCFSRKRVAVGYCFFVAVVVFVPEPFRLKSILAPVAAEELGKINSVTQDKIHHRTNLPARAQSRYAVHFPSIGRAEPHTVDNDDDTESASCHESLRIVLWKIEINLATRAHCTHSSRTSRPTVPLGIVIGPITLGLSASLLFPRPAP